MGAYVNAMLALGLLPTLPEAGLAAPNERCSKAGGSAGISLSDYPELRRLAWQLPEGFELTPEEALGLYELHWRHVDIAHLAPEERALLERLRDTVGKGHLLV